jgi:hypothetical protein
MKYTPFEYLLISTSNHFGLDKKEYSTRLIWAYEHLNELEDLVGQATDQASYTAAVLAIRDTQEGIPSGYLVELDAIASVMQILSTCTRCQMGMRNSGVINGDGRPDPYTKLTRAIGSDVIRQIAKDALMTYFYGSEKEPKKAFGEGEMLDRFHTQAKRLAPHAYIIRNVLIKAWEPFALSHDWVLPNGSNVHKRVWQTVDTKITVPNLDKRSYTFRHKINKGQEKGVSLAADVTHSIDGLIVSEMQARCNYEVEHLEYKKDLIEFYIEDTHIYARDRFPSLGKLDYLDADNISEFTENDLAQMLELINLSLAYKSFPVVTIHDAYKCHANNIERLREAHRRIMWDLYNSDLMFDIIEQITGVRHKNAPFDQSVADAILEADYNIN